MTVGARVIGYTRVSTREQGDSGLGLEAQERAIRAECDRRGWTLLAIEQDVASGKRADNRNGLERALAACRSHRVEAIVVAKLDRMSRSVVDAGKILEEAARGRYNVVALDIGLDLSTPTGELVANVLASVARWERRVIGQRISEALQAKMAQGWRPPAAQVISGSARRRICQLHRRGLSERAIAERLNAEGVPAVGKRWHRNTVRRVLDQEAAA